MQATLWIPLTIGFTCWLVSWAVFARFRLVPPPVRDAAPLADGPSISVVVPARDEASNLARLLPSLASQSLPPREIIVVDDQSSDGTAAVAREHGARVVPGKPPPDGWLGKPWACRQGTDEAVGDWLLFLDADTVLAPGALDRLSRLAAHDRAVHSVCPHHRVVRLYEQASAFFNVIMILGMNAFTLRGSRARDIGLFGQVMLVAREDYERIGGHGAARGEVLENFHLARHFAAAGIACRCYLGKGTVSMRMFPDGFESLVAGWSKGFVSGAKNTARGALIGVSVWLTGLMTATVLLCFLPLAPPPVATAILGLYLLCALQAFYLFRMAGSFSAVNALFFPAALIFYQRLFFWSLLRRRRGKAVRWKGRDVL